MAQMKHDSYPRPVVAEALCELHFVLPQGKEWDGGLFGEFYRAVQGEYPKMEPRSEIALGGRTFPGGLRQDLLAGFRMIYRHKDRPHLVQLASSVVTVNELAPYPGWGAFLKDIEGAWRRAQGILDAKSVRRIGLRYINRIPRKNPKERVSSWLKSSVFYPEYVLEQRNRFFSRLECALDGGNRVIVNLAEASEEGGARPIVFDIDAILEEETGVEWDDLERRLEDLHDRIWEVFSSGLTPRLEGFMKGDDDA